MQHHRATLLFVVLTSGTISAQRPPSWVADATPNVPASAINNLGKLTWFLDAGRVHVFSAATRTWAVRPVSATATVKNTNDFLLIDEGTSITALSSARGRFETLQISPGGFVVNSPSGRNDGVVLVLDGTTLSWFSGFTGRWKQRTVTPTSVFAVQRNTALMIDGTSLFGLSALFDDWVAHTSANPITVSGVGDTVGWASDGTDAHAFSAIRNAWSQQPLPAGASPMPNSQNDIAIWSSATELLGFSGVRGRFDRAVTGEATAVKTSDHLAHAASADLRRHWLFSVPQGIWTTLQTAQPVAAQLDAAVALLREPTQVHGYSAMHAGVSTVPVAATSLDTNATVGAVLDASSGDLRLFSALTQAWYLAPSAALRSIPTLARNGALLGNGGSMSWAFSARSGRFVSRVNGGNAATRVDAGSSLIAVEDDRALAIFDPRREVWIQTPLQAGDRPLQVAIWRTTLVATTATGGEAIGYGVLDGVIERTALAGPVATLIASSEVGIVVTPGQVLGFSPVADVRTEAQFPEFRRMFTRGAPVDLKFVGSAGAAVGAILSRPSPFGFDLGGWGEFTLDPTLLISISPGALDAEGLQTVGLPVPDLIELTGVELAVQALFVPLAQQPYLSRMGSFRISAAVDPLPLPRRASRDLVTAMADPRQ